MLNSLSSFPAAYFKPSDYDSSDWAKAMEAGSTNPFTSAGAFAQPAPFKPPYPGSPLIPNTKTQQALDAIKSDTGLTIDPRYNIPNNPAEQGSYAGRQPWDRPDSRTVNLASPNLNVLLHESGHAVDPNLANLGYGTPFNFQDFKQNSTPSDQLKYIWQHGSPYDEQGFPAVQAETEAQRFARGYAYQLSPAMGHTMTSDPWFSNYPKSYGDSTIQDYWKNTFPTSDKVSFGISGDVPENTTNQKGGENYWQLKLALDPKFQQTQRDILQQTNDYVDSTLR